MNIDSTTFQPHLPAVASASSVPSDAGKENFQRSNASLDVVKTADTTVHSRRSGRGALRLVSSNTDAASSSAAQTSSAAAIAAPASATASVDLSARPVSSRRVSRSNARTRSAASVSTAAVPTLETSAAFVPAKDNSVVDAEAAGVDTESAPSGRRVSGAGNKRASSSFDPHPKAGSNFGASDDAGEEEEKNAENARAKRSRLSTASVPGGEGELDVTLGFSVDVATDVSVPAPAPAPAVSMPAAAVPPAPTVALPAPPVLPAPAAPIQHPVVVAPVPAPAPAPAAATASAPVIPYTASSAAASALSAIPATSRPAATALVASIQAMMGGLGEMVRNTDALMALAEAPQAAAQYRALLAEVSRLSLAFVPSASGSSDQHLHAQQDGYQPPVPAGYFNSDMGMGDHHTHGQNFTGPLGSTSNAVIRAPDVIRSAALAAAPSAVGPASALVMLNRRDAKYSIPDYLSQQPQITAGMRSVLVDWMCEVGIEHRIDITTHFVAVRLVDRLLATVPVPRKELQLVGASCVLLAAKLEEVHPLPIRNFELLCDSIYSRAQFVTMESVIMRKLQYSFHSPTVATHMHELHAIARTSTQHQVACDFLMFVSTLDYSLALMPQGVVAAAIFILAARACARADASSAITDPFSTEGLDAPTAQRSLGRRLVRLPSSSTGASAAGHPNAMAAADAVIAAVVAAMPTDVRERVPEAAKAVVMSWRTLMSAVQVHSDAVARAAEAEAEAVAAAAAAAPGSAGAAAAKTTPPAPAPPQGKSVVERYSSAGKMGVAAALSPPTPEEPLEEKDLEALHKIEFVPLRPFDV